MKKLALLSLAAVLVLTVGCSKDGDNGENGESAAVDTHEDAVERQITLMNEMADVLATVQDEESAKAAKPKLEALGKKMESLKAKMDEMDEPDMEKQEALKEKYEKDLEEAMGRMMPEMMRVTMNPQLKEALGDSLESPQPE